MCACSRSSRTGVAVDLAREKSPPNTRSARIASVAVRSCSVVNPVHAAASARPCSKATHCGDRNGRMAIATMTMAVATAVASDAARPARVFTRPIVARQARLVGPYSSSSVFAWSHQPSSIGSDGRRPRRARAAPRRTRSPKARQVERRGCRGVLRSAAWIISWCSSGPKPARLSISASSRHIRTSFGSAATWSARVWRRVGVSDRSSRRPGREDPLVVEPVEVGGLDARQLVDRWHGRMMPRRDARVVGFGGVRTPLLAHPACRIDRGLR